MNAGTMTRPQMWNRYSYVMNSPMNFTDPTGRVPCKITLTGKDSKIAGVKSGTRVDGECVERKAPPRSLFSFNFPYLSHVLERRAQKAREGQPNESTFTPSQCQSLFAVGSGKLVKERNALRRDRATLGVTGQSDRSTWTSTAAAIQRSVMAR
jgi:hypothetical protein